MKFKKTVVLMLLAVLLIGVCGLAVSAATESGEVYVTVSDASGRLVLALEPVPVSDADGDGAVTVNDALLLAHEKSYPGGAEQGYASTEGPYGLMLTKLWGVENGGSYGYYCNDAAAMSLADPVKPGDRITAYVYTDLETWSDTYCFFDRSFVSAEINGEVTLQLMAAGFDAEFNPITVPVEGAVILLNGEKTSYRTDAQGKVTLRMKDGGSVLISAASDTQTLVPPACVATVTSQSSVRGYAILVLLGVTVIAAVIDGIVRRSRRV